MGEVQQLRFDNAMIVLQSEPVRSYRTEDAEWIKPIVPVVEYTIIFTTIFTSDAEWSGKEVLKLLRWLALT